MLFLVRNSLEASKCIYLRTNWSILIFQQRFAAHTLGGNQPPTQSIKLPEPGDQKKRKFKRKETPKPKMRAELLDVVHTEWSSVFDTASSYNRSVIPLHIRMGRPKQSRKNEIPPLAEGNVELLKIPNFFHLTPPAIEKHCKALKEYCVPWPENVGSRPVRITTINHIYAGPSIRHPDSRCVKLQINLADLKLDEHAYRKFVLLVGDRYNPNNGELTIITDKCPTRKQNKEYGYYLLTALYHEAIKTEPWEAESDDNPEEDVYRDVEKVKMELNPKHFEEKKIKRQYYRVINNKLVTFNKEGHPFVFEMRKYGIKGGLTREELQMAKQEWKNIQKDLPDTSTFDAPYKPSKWYENSRAFP